MADDAVEWITVNGAHIPIKEGQSKDEAIRDHFGKEPPDDKENVKARLDAVKRIYEIDVRKSINNGEVPSGWYVHGRRGEYDDLKDTGHVIEMTKSTDVAKQYSGENGSTWAIKEPSKFWDARDRSATDKFFDKVGKDIEKGTAPPGVEDFYNSCLEQSKGDIDEAKNIFNENMNPKNIVESAGFWDLDNSSINYFYEKTKMGFVKVNGGALSLDIGSLKRFKI